MFDFKMSKITAQIAHRKWPFIFTAQLPHNIKFTAQNRTDIFRNAARYCEIVIDFIDDIVFHQGQQFAQKRSYEQP
jgi:hypothetical protein